MQAAIQQCEQCHDVCVRTVTHCLDQGNSHAQTSHIRALLDCIDFCATCASCFDHRVRELQLGEGQQTAEDPGLA